MEFRETNHGTTPLTFNRVSKLYDLAEKKYEPKSFEKMSEWEIINTPIPDIARKNALKHRTAYYQRLFTKDEIKYTLSNSNMPMISFDIFDGILTAPEGKVPMPKNDERRLGQHCVCVCGYDKDYLTFANSWGTKWGDKGYGYLPWEYVEHYVYEIWVTAIFSSKELNRKNIIDTGFFKDKRNLDIKYELFEVKPLNPFNGAFFVLNLKNPKTKRTMGWAHFSYKDKEVLLEEIFIDKDNRKVGWGSAALKIISDASDVKKIKGWVSAVDCRDEYKEKALKAFFKKNGFLIFNDTSKFRGCLFRLEKKIS
jgi:hypothetical protein